MKFLVKSQVMRCHNKKLSYRKETALQGGSVLAENGRRYSADIISLSSTTVTQSASNAIEFGKNKGYYTVQGHSRSPIVGLQSKACMRLPISYTSAVIVMYVSHITTLSSAECRPYQQALTT